MKVKLLISFVIYTYCFCNLGNTCYRINHTGKYCLNLLPLFTEGFIGPIRSLFLLLCTGNFNHALHYFIFELTNLSNPYTCYYVVNLADKLIKKNF